MLVVINSKEGLLSVSWAAALSYRWIRSGVKLDRKMTASRWNPEGRRCVGWEGCNLRSTSCWRDGERQLKATRKDRIHRGLFEERRRLVLLVYEPTITSFLTRNRNGSGQGA